MPPYQFGNPMNDFYIRQAQQLAQNQPQFQQAPQHQYQQSLQFPHPAPQAQPQIVASIVTNIDEAKATKVDPFTACVFIDTSNGKIYFKKMNDKFQSDFFVYSQEMAQTEPQTDPFDEIRQRLVNIENTLGGMANAKPVSDISVGDEKSDVGAAAEHAEENAGSKPAAFQRGNEHAWRKK